MRLVAFTLSISFILIAAALVANVSPAPRLLEAVAPPGAFFLNTTTSTNGPSLRIDPDGGMHVASATRATGILSTYDRRLPAYYAYCAAGSDCSLSANWSQTLLAENVQVVQLELTPQGQPRLLLQTAEQPPSGSGYASFWYAECDTDCTDPDKWSMIDIVDTEIIDTTYWERPNHSFALDPAGRPRFVFGEGVVVYAFCDTGCTDVSMDPETGANVAINWSGTLLARGLYGTQRALAFTSAGQPRIGALVYNPNGDEPRFTVDYFECRTQCDDATQWSQTALMPWDHSPESVSVRVDREDRVGVAVTESSSASYWLCTTDCSELANWQWTRWPTLTPVQDADLAFDHQDAPHLALRSSGGSAGWGLWHIWCVSDCTAGGRWAGEIVEDADALPRALPLLPPNNCRLSGWMGDFRPSLAVDAAGTANFAFDNEFWITCSDYLGIRTLFSGVRVLVGGQAQELRALAPSSVAQVPAEHGTPKP
jgi:hypothetical protein